MLAVQILESMVEKSVSGRVALAVSVDVGSERQRPPALPKSAVHIL